MGSKPTVEIHCETTNRREFITESPEEKLRDLQRRHDRLEQFANEMAEHDCEYGDECPDFKKLNHGHCIGCRAREAISDANLNNRGCDTCRANYSGSWEDAAAECPVHSFMVYEQIIDDQCDALSYTLIGVDMEKPSKLPNTAEVAIVVTLAWARDYADGNMMHPEKSAQTRDACRAALEL